MMMDFELDDVPPPPRPMLFRMPYEMQLLCLSFLGRDDLARLTSVCTTIAGLLLDESKKEIASLWQALCLHEVGWHPHLSACGPLDLDWRVTLKRWLSGRCSWANVEVDGTLPSERFLHRACMAEDRTVYCCSGMGAQNLVLMDVWRLSFDASGERVRCEQIIPTPEGAQPVARYAATVTAVQATNPSTGKRGVHLVAFGGASRHHEFLNDTWMCDVEEKAWWRVWPPVDAEPPMTRWGHSAVGFANRVFMFGGSCPGQAFNDLWCLDPDHESGQPMWKRVDVQPGGPMDPAPSARGGHSAAVALGRYMYVFGGNTLQQSFNDLWRIDLQQCADQGTGTWEKIDALGETPSERIGHVSWAIGHRLFISGGRDFLNHHFCETTHVLDLRTHTWSQQKMGGVSMVPRTGAAAFACPWGFAVFGGLSRDHAHLGDLKVLDVLGPGDEEVGGVGRWMAWAREGLSSTLGRWRR